MNRENGYPSSRLFCLDALRGLDMILLIVIGRLFRVCNGVFHFPEPFARQFDHAWGGFTLWDIIMPLFIFMCGAAIPFALPKRLDAEGRPTAAFWKHVFGRVALLWVLGMLCQGFLAKLDLMWINPYSNTLQAIAAGYLIAALVLIVPGRIGRVARWATPIVLAGGYALLMHFCGDYTKEGNFPQIVEHAIRVRLLPAGSDAISNWGYTWFLTTMMFGAMTLCGMNATDILRGAGSKGAKVAKLFGLGAVLLAVGWAVTPWVPMIKHVYTFSFTAQAMGWCVLALAVLYVVNDIWMCRRGWGLVLLYGQYALWAYMIGECFGNVVDAFSERITMGFPHVFGAAMALPLTELVSVCAITACLMLRHVLKRKMS